MSSANGFGRLHLLLIAAVIWAMLGSPAKTIANWFWHDSAAPWETVDAFYYPNRNDLTSVVQQGPFSSVDECRDWVNAISQQFHDPGVKRGDYECGVGKIKSDLAINVYRLTVR